MFIREARKFKMFETINVYNESNLNNNFKKKFNHLLNKDIRGFGYWIWKSQIVFDKLNELKNGEILLYIDVGSSLNYKGFENFIMFLKKLENSKKGIIGCRTVSFENLEEYYTSEDVFSFFEIKKNSKIRKTPHFEAGFLLIKKTKDSIRIINKWRNICQNNLDLLKGEKFRLKNSPKFLESRHDQSILSVLFKKEDIDSIPGFFFYKNHLLPDKRKNILYEDFIFINDDEKPFLHTRRKIWSPLTYFQKALIILFKRP